MVARAGGAQGGVGRLRENGEDLVGLGRPGQAGADGCEAGGEAVGGGGGAGGEVAPMAVLQPCRHLRAEQAAL